MLTCIPPVNCTGWPDGCGLAQPDPDIAGIGVILSFALTALITAVASVAVFLLRSSSYEDNFPPPDPIKGRRVLSHGGEADFAWSEESPCIASRFLEARNLTRHQERKERWVKILDKLILNLSDQQLATSFAILIVVFIRHCQISNYHLNVACDLAWFSTVTHLLSVIVLRKYWRHETRRLVLYVRLALMFGVVVMLTVALTWSPQYLPSAGNGGCPAYCAFIEPDASSWFSECEFPVQHTILNFAGVIQTILLVWGYSTTGQMIWPFWFSIHLFFTWTLPGYVFKAARWITLAGVTRMFDANQGTETAKIFDLIRHGWKVIWFPSTKTSIAIQTLSWCYGLTFLTLDRWISETSVTDPAADNAWGFGQLLAMIIIFLPLLPLLEAWSEESPLLKTGKADDTSKAK